MFELPEEDELLDEELLDEELLEEELLEEELLEELLLEDELLEDELLLEELLEELFDDELEGELVVPPQATKLETSTGKSIFAIGCIVHPLCIYRYF